MLGPPAAGVSRYPRVVPGWRRRIACTRNVPTANSPGSTCCTVSFADKASSGTGNTAGSICWRRIASSDVVPWREPQMRTALPGAKNGLKWGSPWIWSQCACDSRRSEEHTSELQSHHDLVCRLLLEKKKKIKRQQKQKL